MFGRFEDGKLFFDGLVEFFVCEVVIRGADEDLCPAFEKADAFQLFVKPRGCCGQGKEAVPHVGSTDEVVDIGAVFLQPLFEPGVIGA